MRFSVLRAAGLRCDAVSELFSMVLIIVGLSQHAAAVDTQGNWACKGCRNEQRERAKCRKFHNDEAKPGCSCHYSPIQILQNRFSTMLAKVMSFFLEHATKYFIRSYKKRKSCLLLVTDQEGNKCLIFKATSNRKHIEKGPANYFVSLILSEMGVFYFL